MKKAYILTKDVRCPIVDGHNYTHRPIQVKTKLFKKGQIVKGELKHSDNQPAFVLVGKMCVIPIDAVKELSGKDVTSKFSGADMDEKQKTPDQKKNPILTNKNPKIAYIDAMIIGGILGFVGMYYAEKKQLITSEDSKLKMYGAIGGALAGVYLVYRTRASQTIQKTETK
jgi:hypothetical protein